MTFRSVGNNKTPIAHAILERRKKLNLSQEEAAGRYGMSKTILAELETNYIRNVQFDTIIHLSLFLRVSMATVCELLSNTYFSPHMRESSRARINTIQHTISLLRQYKAI